MMNLYTAQAILNEAISGLETAGVLNPDGSFNSPTTVQDVEIAALVEALAAKHGVKVPAKIDKLVKILPLALELVN